MALHARIMGYLVAGVIFLSFLQVYSNVGFVEYISLLFAHFQGPKGPKGPPGPAVSTAMLSLSLQLIVQH